MVGMVCFKETAGSLVDLMFRGKAGLRTGFREEISKKTQYSINTLSQSSFRVPQIPRNFIQDIRNAFQMHHKPINTITTTNE